MRKSVKRALGIVAIWAGANMAAGILFRRRRLAYAGDRRHFLLVHGGEDVRPAAEELRDAVVSIFMGGLVLDLRGLDPAVRPLRLDVRVVMGGLEIQVPDDWRVLIDVETSMGGVEEDRPALADPDRPADLVVKGKVTFGGLEVTGG